MADDPTDLYALAGRLSAGLRGAGIAHAISGSVAMAAHGYVRGTLDIDVLVVTSALSLPSAFEVARRLGFAGDDRDLVTALRERGVAALRRGPVAIEFLVPVLPYHRTLVERAVRFDVRGEPVPFVSLDDLFVLKMLWSRRKDLADVEALAALPAGRLDAEFIERTLASILPAGDERIAATRELLRRRNDPPPRRVPS